MASKVIGIVLLLWGLSMPYMLYQTSQEQAEGKTMGLVVGGVMCLVLLFASWKLLKRQTRPKSNVYYINRNYYPRQVPRRRR